MTSSSYDTFKSSQQPDQGGWQCSLPIAAASASQVDASWMRRDSFSYLIQQPWVLPKTWVDDFKSLTVQDVYRIWYLPSWVLQAFSWRELHLTYTLLEIDSCPWYKLSHLTHSRLLGELNSWNVQMLSWLLCWGNIICPPCAAVKRKKGLT